MNFEIELRETQGREPELHGIILQEGRAASRRSEIFAPGSVSWPANGIEIRAVHKGATESRAHPVRGSDGTLSIRARATDALREAIQAGKKYMSVEFSAIEQRNTEGGIREITRAMVFGAALVSSPEYLQTAAELRSTKRRMLWL